MNILNKIYIAIYLFIVKEKLYKNENKYLLLNISYICNFNIKFIHRLIK